MSDLTRALRGKRIAAVLTNGHVLQIRTEDGAELNVAWADDHGDAIKGRPVVARHGFRLHAAGVRDLAAVPQPIWSN